MMVVGTVTTSERVDRVAERVRSAGVDVLLVSDPVNLRYLTGYTGSNGLALIGPDLRRFVTDFRYVERAAAEVDSSFERIRAQQDLLSAVPEVIEAGPIRLGFEEAHVTVLEHSRLQELLGDRATLMGVRGIVEELRAVKDRDELERIRRASELADAALREVLDSGLVGRSEREVALALEATMRRLGAERPSFDTIVAAGDQGALPHAVAGENEIGSGQVVVIDWGAQVDGYCSDCTRTVVTGDVDGTVREVYELVLEAQLAGVQAVGPGAVCRAVDAVARERIEAGGYGEHFGHNLGHGVGLNIHEEPRLSRSSDTVLAAGNVVTVEPGIYLPGAFGVRIEDLVVITAEGSQILSSLSKELTVVG